MRAQYCGACTDSIEGVHRFQGYGSTSTLKSKKLLSVSVDTFRTSSG